MSHFTASGLHKSKYPPYIRTPDKENGDQDKRGIEDNSKIIFLISQEKLSSDPSLDLSG